MTITAAMEYDSESEYDYDLSAEEEQLLASLIDGASPIALASTTQALGSPSHVLELDTSNAPRSTLKDDIESAFGGPASTVDLGLAEDALLNTSGLETDLTHSHAPNPLHTSPKGKYPMVGIARTDSVETFVKAAQPEPMPSVLSADVIYPDLKRALSKLKPEPRAIPDPDDTRPPVARFRTFPRKPFSVSDLTAGAWCELQYEYTLTLLPGGKKTRTTAMKRGSTIHQKLEDEVHTTVRVEIATKEDAFGLKIWNIIQGLRTLRDTGFTRELEIWGMVDGNLVNGIIDGLSYQNPSPEFEEEWLSSQKSQEEDSDKQKITDFFPTDSQAKKEKKTKNKKKPGNIRKIYLMDVKTRAATTPPKGAALRPTKVQLYLYHRFLSDMASDKLDYLQVFARYGLNVDDTFSDAFLAQIGELHDDVFYDASSALSDSTSKSSEQHDLVRYRTLRELIPLLRSELILTFPEGAENLGSVVTVEYRSRADGGQVISSNVIAVDHEVLDLYLKENMEWWRGERKARGVEIEEAYKCGFCEFADRCTWREDMDQGHLKSAREKLAARAQAGGDEAIDNTPARTRPGKNGPMLWTYNK